MYIGYNTNPAKKKSCRDVDFIVDDLTRIPHVRCSNKTSYYLNELDFVVSEGFVSEFDVCSIYCTQIVNGNCIGPNQKHHTAHELWTNCLNRITINTCIGTVPLAKKRNRYLYPLRPTSVNCISQV